MRKINDELLLKMLDEKRPQNEIAAFFSVSPSAVCQRVAKLTQPPPPDPLEKFNLTDQQRRFVVSKAEGKSNTAAALDAYNCTTLASAANLGSEVMENENVKYAISELMDHHGLTKSYRIKKLRQHVDSKNPDVSLKALDMSWKLDRSYGDDQEKNANYFTLIIQEASKSPMIQQIIEGEKVEQEQKAD